MTREGIKAVRFCMGYNTNLRVKLHSVLPGAKPFQESIARFLEDNLYGIYGPNVMEKLGLPPVAPSTLSFDDQMKFLSFLEKEANDVCNGVPRDNFSTQKVWNISAENTV